MEQFYNIFNIPPKQTVERLFTYCQQKDDQRAIETLISLLDNGYSIIDLLNLLLKTVINSDQIKKKEEYIEIISQYFLLNETTLSITNLYGLVYSLIKA